MSRGHYGRMSQLSSHPQGGGGSTLIFSNIHVRRLGSFLGSKFEFQYFFIYFFFFFFGGGGGGVKERNIFWGMKILWILFGVITK